MKTYIVGNSYSYHHFLKNQEVVDNIEDADVVIFTGGEDVFPVLYDEKKHPYTSYNRERDLKEAIIYDKAKKLNKPMLGICRGAQFLTVLNNGKLVQHVNGQPYMHAVKDIDKNAYMVTSTHHQMMFPFNLADDDYTIIAHTTNLTTKWEGLPKGYENYPNTDGREIEVVHYPKTNCLCIQGHPEYEDADAKFVKYTNRYIQKYLLNNDS